MKRYEEELNDRQIEILDGIDNAAYELIRAAKGHIEGHPTANVDVAAYTLACAMTDDDVVPDNYDAYIGKLKDAACGIYKDYRDLHHNTSPLLEWNMEFIGEMADAACDILKDAGYKVLYPFITDEDGIPVTYDYFDEDTWEVPDDKV